MADNFTYKRMVDLVSSDNITFTVSRATIRQSGLVNNMIQDLGLDEPEAPQQPIPLPNVDSNILARIVDYCEHHQNSIIPVKNRKQMEISQWDEAFLDVEQVTLYHLMMAANYMDIKNLVRACAKVIAGMIKGKSTAQMRKLFNIKNDFTPAEEQLIRQENSWCENLPKE